MSSRVIEHKDPQLELSGVARTKRGLAFVDDERTGIVLHHDLDRHADLSTRPLLLKVARQNLRSEVVTNRLLAADLEGIALIDGEPLLLSERAGALFDAHGERLVLSVELGELGNRGLEGVAVRITSELHYEVAVLWEGGYLEPDDLSQELSELLPGAALPPRIVVHRLYRETREANELRADLTLSMGGVEARAKPGQRFRATDLVWSRGGNSEWIVLLGSTGDPRESPNYAHTWLQRFDHRGTPVGEPFDLRDHISSLAPDLARKNWEGLAWWDESSLVLVYDGGGDETSHALIVALPEGW